MNIDGYEIMEKVTEHRVVTAYIQDGLKIVCRDLDDAKAVQQLMGGSIETRKSFTTEWESVDS